MEQKSNRLLLCLAHLTSVSLANLETYQGYLSRFVIMGKKTSNNQVEGCGEHISSLYSLIDMHLLMNIKNKIPKLREY